MIKRKINIRFYLIPGLIIISFLLRLVSAYFLRDIIVELVVSNSLPERLYSSTLIGP